MHQKSTPTDWLAVQVRGLYAALMVMILLAGLVTWSVYGWLEAARVRIETIEKATVVVARELRQVTEEMRDLSEAVNKLAGR